MTLEKWQRNTFSNECFIILQTKQLNEIYPAPTVLDRPFILFGELYLKLLFFFSYDIDSVLSIMHTKLNRDPLKFVRVLPQVVFQGTCFVLHNRILHHFESGHMLVLTIKLYDVNKTKCCLYYAYELEDNLLIEMSKVNASCDVFKKLAGDLHYFTRIIENKKSITLKSMD